MCGAQAELTIVEGAVAADLVWHWGGPAAVLSQVGVMTLFGLYVTCSCRGDESRRDSRGKAALNAAVEMETSGTPIKQAFSLLFSTQQHSAEELKPFTS